MNFSNRSTNADSSSKGQKRFHQALCSKKETASREHAVISYQFNSKLIRSS